ncbi:major facilitator superfamily domain-containing protein [Calycina marina]|uniref:Major facilitator superfamily domain-containing protein n=1 Tax=Calycina marina TaxID=1763456 RepID=A0A9P7YWE9_9HELO|nr:major facilitator superfamily domain-containing protein [Calycina marina]
MNALQKIERILSRPVAKPYRSKHIGNGEPYLNADGNVDFYPGDVENPLNWSKARRWYLTMVSVLLVCNATFASSSPSGSLGGPNGIAVEFGVSAEVAGLVVTLFLLGYCFGPLFWAPLSEFYGRRWISYISFTGYIAFNFLCAWAPNFAALLIGRFLTGTFASAPLSNAPGVMVDIWPALERGNAMALFSMMTFVGPAIGPVISGFLELKKNWHWSFYVLIWLGAATALLLLTIPETYPPQVLLNKAKRIRAKKIPGFENVKAPIETSGKTLTSIFKVALSRPWIILFDTISLLIAIYVAFVYALVYMLFTIYPIVFQQQRGWNAGVGELPLISVAVGAMIGGAVIFKNTAIDRNKIKAGHVCVPEDRLILGMIGGVMFPICLFWFSWTGEYNSVPWIVICIAGTLLSTSIQLIFVAFINYLTDTYLIYAASAMAANTVARSAAGAAAPLFTQKMFDALGVGGGGSLIGGIAVLLAPIPFVFYNYGAPIRKRSKFAPTPDKKGPQEEREAEEGEDLDRTAGRSASTRGSSTVASSIHRGVRNADVKSEGKNKIRLSTEDEEVRRPHGDESERDMEKGIFAPV